MKTAPLSTTDRTQKIAWTLPLKPGERLTVRGNSVRIGAIPS